MRLASLLLVLGISTMMMGCGEKVIQKSPEQGAADMKESMKSMQLSPNPQQAQGAGATGGAATGAGGTTTTP